MSYGAAASQPPISIMPQKDEPALKQPAHLFIHEIPALNVELYVVLTLTMSIKPLKYAFRITHIENLPHIARFGLTRPDSPNYNPDYKNIGDTQIIDIRKSIRFKGTGINECIPFYFGPRSPMLYVIQHGYNGVKRQSAENIVYCVLRLSDIIEDNIDCFFTNGHPLNALTDLFGKEFLKDVEK